MKNKDKIITNYRTRIEKGAADEKSSPEIAGHREAVLLGELQIAQFELEMQNDELLMAVDLLAAERSKFESFFNLAPTGYFIVDQLGTVEEVNQIGLKLLKIEKTKLVGQRFQSFFVAEDYQQFSDFLTRLTPEGEKGSTVIRIINSTGKLLYVQVEGIVLADNFTGRLQYYLTTIDITESRLAQTELKDATQRLELTLRASGIGTWNLDAATGKLYLDKHSRSLLGLTKHEFDGDIGRIFELVHPDDRLMVREVLSVAFSGTKDVELEFRLKPVSDSIKTMMLKGLKIESGEASSYLVGIIVDITKAKLIEDQRRQLEREKQKIVYEATFIAQEQERERISGALHDSVCQLLYGIRLGLQSLQLNSKTKLDLANINQLITQAIRETRELSYELSPSILRDFGIVAGINEMVTRLTNATFKISANVKGKADDLPAELQHSVFSIFQELLNNCLKHARATKADIMLGIENQEITLMVSDNGIGFDASNLANWKGSGLRNIKNRVFLLDGKMDIENTGNGMKITVKIKF